jgi:excisionase family DNA binding protein
MIDILTRRETADALRLSERTVDKMARDGRLTRLRIGRRGVRFKRAEVERLLLV